MKRRHMSLCFLVLCLTATLLVGVTSSAEYDPWVDGNDDGIIDIVDIVNLAIRFGEEGTPINKTALLLELQDRVAALETRMPQKGYISVPAAAFNPYESAWDTRNSGYHLFNYDSFDAWFFGSVQLPHGATVTNFTTYWKDSGTNYVECDLRRCSSNMIYTMASADSPEISGPGLGSSYDDTINYATVDNTQYMYTLYVSIPYSASHTDYYFNYAIIEYEYPA